MQEGNQTENTSNENTIETKLSKMYRHYESVCELLFDFKMKKVISCIRTKDGKYKAIIRLSNKCLPQSVTIIFQGTFMNRLMCMNYHAILIDKSVTDDKPEQFNENEIQDYIICLPLLRNTNNNERNGNDNLFYIIDDKWMEMNDKCKAMKPW